MGNCYCLVCLLLPFSFWLRFFLLQHTYPRNWCNLTNLPLPVTVTLGNTTDFLLLCLCKHLAELDPNPNFYFSSSTRKPLTSSSSNVATILDSIFLSLAVSLSFITPIGENKPLPR
ncbi:hypothetical protein RJT34_30500 [Clitoria ternatea]|uniref:Uncharacterized protein n=1 Tax=Clitoria ternatea TaxID=43366 RepID=A0AAN9ESI5_CLITE